jgi:hypothetical protein
MGIPTGEKPKKLTRYFETLTIETKLSWIAANVLVLPSNFL